MRKRLNELSGMLIVISIVVMLIGLVLMLDKVIDESLFIYGILIAWVGMIGFNMTHPRKVKPSALNRGKVAGVVLDINGKPELVFENGYAMPNAVARIFLGEYFSYGDWPHDPFSGKRLKMVSTKELRDNDHKGREIS